MQNVSQNSRQKPCLRSSSCVYFSYHLLQPQQNLLEKTPQISKVPAGVQKGRTWRSLPPVHCFGHPELHICLRNSSHPLKSAETHTHTQINATMLFLGRGGLFLERSADLHIWTMQLQKCVSHSRKRRRVKSIIMMPFVQSLRWQGL